ncbi:MAG: ATP-binding protein, partial [Candidatus Dormibacteraceae bacterium]
MSLPSATETDLTIGPEAIIGYSRLPYTMWYALAEFIDNSTQSRLNYASIIDDVLRKEGTPLVVSITYDRVNRWLEVEDNSIGMTEDDLRCALRIAVPTVDSQGRSKYGMGMKTAACWLGRRWTVTTCEWSSGIEWTAQVDVDAIVQKRSKIPLTP